MSRSTELFDSLSVDPGSMKKSRQKEQVVFALKSPGICRIARRIEIGRGSSSLVPTGAVSCRQVVEGGSALTAKRSVGCQRRVAASCASESVCGMSSTGPCDAEPRRACAVVTRSIHAALTLKIVNQPLIISVP
jgi:hypothetical protein